MVGGLSDLSVFIGFAELAAAAFIAYIYAKSKIPKETIEQQKQLIEALEKRVGSMEKDNKLQLIKHLENEKAISELQGQIKVYKELPLQEIANSLKVLEGLPKEFEKVSAASADKIISSVTHVKAQHVDRQTVTNETVKHKK